MIPLSHHPLWEFLVHKVKIKDNFIGKENPIAGWKGADATLKSRSCTRFVGIQDVQMFCKLHGKETRVEQSSHGASVTPYCLAVHLLAGVITTGPWEECFTPWTVRLHSRLACDLLGTIPFYCFLNWPCFPPLPSPPPLLWGCQYLVVCAGPRKTHFCTSKLYWLPDDMLSSHDRNSGPDGRELCSLTTGVLSFS